MPSNKVNSAGTFSHYFAHNVRGVLNIFRSIFLNRFEPDDRHLQQVPVRVINDKGFSAVEFYNSPKHDEDRDRHLLCRLNFRLPPLKRDSKVRLIHLEVLELPFRSFLSSLDLLYKSNAK